MENFDLFNNKTQNSNLPPLAERMRPTNLEDFVGQKDIVGQGKILYNAIKNKKVFSMIFWGPPGSGKTTLAKLIAKQSDAKFYQISAVSSGVKEVRSVIERAKLNRHSGITTILFIDEIHRFNKAQQDALLHAVEDGSIVLIGATTENPSFEVISPLLSRCRVLKLYSLNEDELDTILENAVKKDIILSKFSIIIEGNARLFLLKNVNGDARKLLNAIEIAVQFSSPREGMEFHLNLELIKESLQRRDMLYDKKGDYHYDTISAFIKSVRGSDPDAAIYWLAVMLEGGEDPLFIARRLIILASEDIGNADPSALPLAVAGFQAAHSIGMPEAAIVLSQVTTYLSSVPKSNASYMAITNATKEVKEGNLPDVPLHLRNAPTGLMRAFDYGKDYEYPHNYPEHFKKVNYFPKKVKSLFYKPTSLGREKYLRERLKNLWPDRYKEEK
jgi:putative ATPase